MLIKATIFALLACYVAARRNHKCVCVDDDGSTITVTQTPIEGVTNGPGTGQTTFTIVIPVMGPANSEIHYDTIRLPPQYKTSFQHVTTPAIASFTLTEDRLRRQNAPPQVLQRIEGIRGKITERLNAGNNLSTREEFEEWLFNLSKEFNLAASDLSALASSAEGSPYSAFIYSLIVQLMQGSSFYSSSSDAGECIYKQAVAE